MMDERTPDPASLTKCPKCGLVSEGQRCERCNALKVLPCSGACSMCGLSRCVAPKVKEKGGL